MLDLIPVSEAQADVWRQTKANKETGLELAQLHSQAVDYPKSGVPAKMKRELRPSKWPHFQENRNRAARKTYKSKKILGMLYDQVELVDFKPQYENAFDSRILNAFQLDEATIEKAKDIKTSYDSALKRLMAKHEIRTEFEAWSVFVLYHNLEARDYTFAEEFGRTVGNLKAQFVETCCAAAGATSKSDFPRLAPFIAAMYTATAREMEAALKECREIRFSAGKFVPVPAREMDPDHMPLISFPWLFCRELGKIATKSNSFDHQSATIHQGIGHKPTKTYADVALAPAPGLGEVETTQGITRYGELLKLNFSNPVRNNHPKTYSTTKASALVANEFESVVSYPPGPVMSRPATSSTLYTNVNPAKDKHANQTKEENANQMKDENVNQTENEQVQVRISLKKGSALDKLARFA